MDHTIELEPGARPVYESPYRSQKEEIERLVKEMLNEGMVQEVKVYEILGFSWVLQEVYAAVRIDCSRIDQHVITISNGGI